MVFSSGRCSSPWLAPASGEALRTPRSTCSTRVVCLCIFCMRPPRTSACDCTARLAVVGSQIDPQCNLRASELSRHAAELALGLFRAVMACAAASAASAMEEQCGMYVRGTALELNPQAAARARRSTQARRRHGAPRAVPGRGSRRRHRPRRGAEAPAELDFSALLSSLLQSARERAAARPPAAERRPTVAPPRAWSWR